MQLILSTDTEIGIYKKMATIKQDSPHEKDEADTLVEEIMNNITNENKENVDKLDLIVECTEKVNSAKSRFDKDIVQDMGNSKDNIISEINQTKEEISHSNIFINKTIDSRTEVSASGDEKLQENGIEIKDDIISTETTLTDKQQPINDAPVNLIDDDDDVTNEPVEMLLNVPIPEIVTVEELDKICDDSKKSSENGEVIDIADEKSDHDIMESKEVPLAENITEIINDSDSKKNIDVAVENTETKDSLTKNDDTENESVLHTDIDRCESETKENASKDDDSENKSIEDTNFVRSVDCNVIDIDTIGETKKTDTDENKNEATEEINKEKKDKSMGESIDRNENEDQIETKFKEKRKYSLISNLSNTLDILSDEEDDVSMQQESPNLDSAINKQCINIEDDDDIMLIDDEAISKDNTSITLDALKPESENNCSEITTLDEKVECDNEDEPVEITNNHLETVLPETNIAEVNADEEKSIKHDETVQKLPLLPNSFLETCKKKLSSMTHEELEEFCIIKIVDSVVDRSNLGEIGTHLKTMMQKIEGYEKKVFLLTKQNRDLQLVLKSVQEEQKKNCGTSIITPLKITRSVGMQVVMPDKNSRKRPIGVNLSPNNQTTTNSSNRQNKSQIQPNQNPRNPKITPNNQQIPVPRLVPAGNNGNTKNNCVNSTQKTNSTIKPQATNNTTNGVKTTTPTQKTDKRPHFQLQLPSTETVDLTDEEPPAKVTRNNSAPVRCVPPQNLLAPRPPLVQNMNSPRKVYIPIGGPQSQNVQVHKERTGQTVMFRSMSPQTTRPRVPSPNVKMLQTANTLRMGRVTFKHPAPLPETMKQYQPPNWKALPPSPELKLSKVENGIVISWKIDGYQEDSHEGIASYQLFAYQETSSPPSTSLWKKIGDVKALPLPMACTLTQFMAGFKYYFAVRAVDVKSRFGPFSKPGSILLFNTV